MLELMCEPASFVVTEDRVFWSRKSDSHQEIINENKLWNLDNSYCGLVRVEISPPGDDFLLPIDKWVDDVDQDFLPDWYDYSTVVGMCREKLPEWVESKIIFPDKKLPRLGHNVVAIYGMVETIEPGVHVENILGDAVIDAALGADISRISGNGVIARAYSCRIGIMSGRAAISTIDGLSSVDSMLEDSSIEDVYGNTTIMRMVGSANILRMFSHSRVQVAEADSSIGDVCGRSVIERVGGCARIGSVSGYAMITTFASKTPIQTIEGDAVVVSFVDMAPETLGHRAILNIVTDETVETIVGNLRRTAWLVQE
jgi:hypothetical protein